MRRYVVLAVVTVLSAYALYAAVFYWNQRYLLFPIASCIPAPFTATLPGYATLVELPVSYGKARAIFLRGSDRAAPAILYTHGNGELIEQHVRGYDALRARGYHVLLLEYPGYGGADGEPGYDTIVEASLAAYDWLASRPDVDRTRIVAMGKSLGGAPAAELTRHRPVRALVLQSTFTAVADFAAQLRLPSLLVRDPFDTAARLREYTGPVLITHGRRDEVIPFAHGEALAAAARAPTTRWYDCRHNDCPYDADEYRDLLFGFLDGALR